MFGRNAVMSNVCKLPEEPDLYNIGCLVKESVVAHTTFASTAADAEPNCCLLIRLHWHKQQLTGHSGL